MDMVSLVRALVVVALLGLGTFLAVYASTRPWQTPVGRMEFADRAALGAAFTWGVFSPMVPEVLVLPGWAIVIGVAAVVFWWRAGVLISYQLKARHERRDNQDA